MRTLRPPLHRSRTSLRGSTLSVVLIVMVLLAAFASAAFTFSGGNTVIIQRSNAYAAASGVAEGILEVVYSRWRDLASYIPPGYPTTTTPNFNAAYFTTVGANRLGDITRVTPRQLGLPDEMMAQLGLTDKDAPIGTVTLQTVDTFGRRYGSYPAGVCDDSPSQRIQARPRKASGTYYPSYQDPDYKFTGDNIAAKGLPGDNIVYEVKVRLPYQARTSSGTQTTQVEMSRRFTKFYATTAQFAYFFQDNLEFTPGFDLAVDGRSHTNANLKNAPQGTSQLTFNDSVTFVGSATVSNYTGAAPSQTDALPVGGIPTESLSPATNAGNSPNYNNNSLREIIERPVARADLPAGTKPEDTDYSKYWDVGPDQGMSAKQAPIEAARLYGNSGLKILITYDATGKPKVVVRGITKDGKADGPILDDNSNVVKLIKSALNNVTSTDPKGFQGDKDGALNDKGRRTNVNDLRESNGGDSTVGVTTLDLSRFVGSNGEDLLKKEYSGFNGVLYVSDVTGENKTTGAYNEVTDGAGSNYETDGADRKKHGIMLVNANNLPRDLADPDRSFSIVSDNAVYIRGDYNTGGTPGTPYKDPVTGREITRPTVNADAENRVPSSIIADSVGVVSSRFAPEFATGNKYEYLKATDTNAAGNFVNYQNQEIRYIDGPKAGQPIPSSDPNAKELYARTGPTTDSSSDYVLKRGAIPTTVNAAVVGGINDGDGAQNLMRFLENWTAPKYVGGVEDFGSPVLFAYKGSMIELFRPKELTGKKNVNYYSPPQRQTNFDERFLSNSPAGPAVILIYSRGSLLNVSRSPYRG